MKPRVYQTEALEAALNGNKILCLPTGSGKTFIATMLLREYIQELEPDYVNGGKRAFFLVPTRVLVGQQATAIQNDTDFRVGRFSGESRDDDSVHIDNWKKDYWDQQLNKFQVLVMTRRIFLDMLQKGYIANDSIAVIIFDEAHKAAPNKKGNLTGDDYVKIMETLKERGLNKKTRILGLSASLINCHCFNNHSKIPDMISKLQDVYASECFFPGTYGFMEGTNPKEILWLYHQGSPLASDLTKYLESIAKKIELLRKNNKQLDKTIDEVDENEMDNLPRMMGLYVLPVTFREIQKTFSELSRILHQMGPWALYKSVIYTLENYQRILELIVYHEDAYNQLIKLVISYLEDLEIALNIHLSKYKTNDQPLAGIPNKMIRLLQLLFNFQDDNLDLHGGLSAIVFVERRLDAFVLSSWLNEVAKIIPGYSFIKSDYIIGATSIATFPYNVSHRNRKVQEQIIKGFREKNLNVLVATSVLEEGLDIPHCNVIVRYDEPKTFRAYVQSKGRARKKGAYFVFFSSDKSTCETLNAVKMYRCTEDSLVKLAEKSLYDDRNPNFSKLDQTNCLKSPTGAICPLEEAINKVHFYCDHLPGDRFTDKMPRVKIECIENPADYKRPLFICKIQLPKISCLHKSTIEGRKCFTETEAKYYGYFEAVRELWAHEELDDYFSPQSKKQIMEKLEQDMQIDRRKLKEWKKQCEIIRQQHPKRKRTDPELLSLYPPKPGTRKSRTAYSKVYAETLKVGVPTPQATYNLYRIVLHDCPDAKRKLGLLTLDPLPIHELNGNLNISRNNVTVPVTLEVINASHKLEAAELEQILSFHRLLMDQHLRIGQQVNTIGSKISFNIQDPPYRLLIIFLTEAGAIDLESLKLAARQKTPIQPSDYPSLEGKVISKNYGDDNIKNSSYVVVGVDENMTPQSPFPERKYASFEEYFLKKYPEYITRIDPHQPLLQCHLLSSELYSPLSKGILKKKEKSHHQYLIPELCLTQFFSTEYISLLRAIPAFVFKLNMLLIAIDLRRRLCAEIGYGSSEIPPNIVDPKNVEPFTNFVPLDVKVELFPPKKKLDLTSVIYTKDSLINSEEDRLEKDDEEETETDDDSEANGDKDDASLGENEMKEDQETSTTTISPSLARKPVRQEIEVFQPDKCSLFNTSPGSLQLKSVEWNEVEIASRLKTSDQFHQEFAKYFYALSGCADLVPNDSNSDEHGFYQRPLSITASPISKSIYKNEDGSSKHGIPVSLILQALTTKKFDPEVNLERLEIIGDSFLKYAISTFLYLNFPEMAEDKLTWLKMNLVSNFHLLNLAHRKNLAALIFDETFIQKVNWLPPLYSSQVTEFNNQTISDKSVADMMEAMIGAHVINLGEKATVDYMKWLGFPLNIENPIHGSWLPPLDESLSLEILEQSERLYNTSWLRNLEQTILGYTFKRKHLLIEALTHPSFILSRFDSYQKLEFVGDAVLDYLITCYIYDHPKYPNLKPGDVTTIRQALVNNDYFATVAMVNKLNKYIFHASVKLDGSLKAFREKLEDNGLLGDNANRIKLGSFLLDNSEGDALVEAPKVLGDIFESIAGAIYLDSGYSLSAVWQVYSRLIGNELEFFCANVPKSPIKLLTEKYPDAKFKKENINGKSSWKLHVGGYLFQMNPDMDSSDSNNKLEKQLLVRRALEVLKVDASLSNQSL